MSDLEHLADLLAERIKLVPLSVDLWDGEMISKYLKMSQRYVLEQVTCRPDFPKAIHLPGRGMRRWKAREVIDWAEGLRHKNAKSA